ncbi:MAG: hypothetical protein ACKO39_09870, partial [Chthoniobacterales bacterium]
LRVLRALRVEFLREQAGDRLGSRAGLARDGDKGLVQALSRRAVFLTDEVGAVFFEADGFRRDGILSVIMPRAEGGNFRAAVEK